MGIRQSAMGSHSCEYSKSVKQNDLFNNKIPGEPFSGYWPKGTLSIEIAVDLADIGPHADPDDPNYDYFRAVSDAEGIALGRIEELAGKNVKQRYRIEVSSEDEYDQVIVTATLRPKKCN